MAEYCTYEKYVFKKKLETLINKSGKNTELISLIFLLINRFQML
jgi:peptide chain release factor subunit 1